MRESIFASVLIALMLTAGAFLYGQATEGLAFTLINNNTEYAVSQGSATATAVQVPDTYAGLPVTQVAKRGFMDYNNLTSINLPNTIAVIDTFAFLNCTSLATFTIPAGVQSIYTNPFMKCNSLNNLNVAEGNTAFVMEGNTLMRLVDSAVITGFANSVIPANTLNIDDYAFGNIASLMSITIPEGVERIGEYAFTSTSLLSVHIPSSVQLIDRAAFSMCMALGSVTIAEDSPVFLGYGAFTYCMSLSSINLPETLTGIDEYVFSMCMGLTSITIPEGITTIGESTFYLCSSLADITLPQSVTVIGKGAFTSMAATTLQLPSGLTHIGDSAFAFCPNLLSMVLPATVERIDDWAFALCDNMTQINIPLSVAYIGENAFTGCSNLVITAEAPSQPEGWHTGWNPDGCEVIWGSSSCNDDVLYVKSAELLPNYPNPFNPSTTISFSVVKPSPVTVDIFNNKGQRVKRLVNGHLPAGTHNVVWNGVDDAGRAVGSGIYFYTMKTNDYRSVRKMTMVK